MIFELASVRGLRSGIHPHVAANMMKIMALTVENRKFLHEDAISENMEIMKDTLLNYLFEEEPTC